MSESTNNRPIHVLRRRGVKVSIFENRSGDTFFHKFTIQKIYRDDQGAWKTASSYGREDAPIISLLTDRAWEWILDREEQEGQSPISGESRTWSHSTGYSTTDTRTDCHQRSEGETP